MAAATGTDRTREIDTDTGGAIVPIERRARRGAAKSIHPIGLIHLASGNDVLNLFAITNVLGRIGLFLDDD